MAENLYYLGNHGVMTTGMPVKQAIGTAVNVALQLAVPATRQFCIVEWGISFDGSPAAIQVALRQTSAATTFGTQTVPPTVTSLTAGAPASLATAPSTTATAFNQVGSALTPITGTVASFDNQILTTNTYVKQFPMGREPQVAISTFVHILTNAAASVNCTCYIIWRE
jgi:hypothetical protein